jgi:hypothetical protein
MIDHFLIFIFAFCGLLDNPPWFILDSNPPLHIVGWMGWGGLQELHRGQALTSNPLLTPLTGKFNRFSLTSSKGHTQINQILKHRWHPLCLFCARGMGADVIRTP